MRAHHATPARALVAAALLFGLLAGCSNAPQGTTNRAAKVNPATVDRTSRTPVGMIVTWARTVRAGQLHPDQVQWESLLANEDGSVVCLAFRTAGQAGTAVTQRVAFVDGRALQSAADWDRHCSGKVAFSDAEYWLSQL